jgi:hypothetical protein
VAFYGRESVQLLGVSSSALFRSGSVPNTAFAAPKGAVEGGVSGEQPVTIREKQS